VGEVTFQSVGLGDKIQDDKATGWKIEERRGTKSEIRDPKDEGRRTSNKLIVKKVLTIYYKLLTIDY